MELIRINPYDYGGCHLYCHLSILDGMKKGVSVTINNTFKYRTIFKIIVKNILQAQMNVIIQLKSILFARQNISNNMQILKTL